MVDGGPLLDGSSIPELFLVISQHFGIPESDLSQCMAAFQQDPALRSVKDVRLAIQTSAPSWEALKISPEVKAYINEILCSESGPAGER